MDNLFMYLLKVAAGTIIFYLTYIVFFRKETFYNRNRIFLLLSIIIPVIVPLLKIPVTVQTLAPVLAPDGLTNLFSAEAGSIFSQTPAAVESSFNLMSAGLWIYFSIAGLIILRGLISVFSAYNIIRKGLLIKGSFPRIVLSDLHLSPFSFFPYAVIPSDEYEGGNYSDILDHEFAHLRQGHTFDLLLSEIFIAFQWFNPIAWLIKRSVVLNHEYLADHVSVSHRSVKDYQYRLLNIASEMRPVALAHTFNSLIKNRIIMINKKPTHKNAAWKTLLIIPAVMALSYAFVKPEYKYITTEAEPLTITQSPLIIQKEVNGIVLKEDGKPLEGVNVSSTGTLGNVMSVMTDANGKFKLPDLQKDAILLFSCRGYASASVRPDFKKEMKIIMSKDGSFIDTKYVNPPAESSNNKPLVVFDGVISDKTTAELISKLGNEFGTVQVLKGKEAIDKYGEKGKYGVEEVFSRKKASEIGLKFPFRRISPDEYPTFQSKNFTTFQEWVISNTKYPSEAISKDIQGRVTISYTVEADGSVTNVKMQGKSDPLLADAVIKTVQGSPKWEQAVKEDARLPFSHMLSLRFVMPDKILPDDVYVVTEIMPMYPGGDVELLKFIAGNAKYPEAAKAEKAEGRVILRFIVTKEGNADDISVLKSVHPLLDEEAVRVVSLLKGFEPGKQGGVAVNVWYMVPVTFVMPGLDEEAIEPLRIRSKDGKTPLIVVDSVITDSDVSKIDSKTIESVHVLKDQMAIDKYGEKGRDGVVEIITKKGTTSVPAESEIPFVVVEDMPQFPGGNTAMLEWIAANLKYPEEALIQKAEGKVILRFVVSSEGKVAEAVVLRSDNQVFNEEALRLVNSMPLWKPGSQNGKKVNVYSMVPVEFKVK